MEAVRTLHENWVTDYTDWLERLPERPKGWFAERYPCIVTCQYGQNKSLYTASDPQDRTRSLEEVRQGQESAWQANRQWHLIRFVSLAISTDVK